MQSEDSPRVSVDVEATLANTHEAMLLVQNARHGTEYTMEDITYWNWVADAMDFDEFMRIGDMNWVRQPLAIAPCQTQPPLAESLERLASITSFDIVTARDGSWYTETEEEPYESVSAGMQAWLDAYGITMYESFHAISFGESKADLGYDVYVDDNPNLADDLEGEQHQLLIEQPFNTDARDHPRVTPVKNVNEAVDVIERQFTVAQH